MSVITIVHSYVVPAEFLGFEIDEGALPSSPSIELGIDDQVEDVGGDPSSSVHLPTIPEERPAEPPAARDGDELPPSERVIIAPTDGSVVIEGVRIGEDCTLKVMRTACETLGLSTRGFKRECMSRLQKFIQHQELLATHAAASTMQAESKRHAHEQKRPVQLFNQMHKRWHLTI